MNKLPKIIKNGWEYCCLASSDSNEGKMQELVRFYKEYLGFDRYYEIILSNINSCPSEFINNDDVQ